ncbi:lymphoid-specific helicase-like [Schistocerca serialis cubense]|uniref:lymphoid-specific helicase-like n=1 Tax=Schistocerca serialis cubense TaxID=2023355 RepID=UPI00214E9988|nr:lymphoid-specific helicase-like [Schistocerca serialis cubense]
MDLTAVDASNIGSVITSDVLEEEKRLAEKAEQAERELQKQLEEQQAQELKEQRMKRLLHLLTKSEFYACFLKKKLEETQLENKIKERKKKIDTAGPQSTQSSKLAPLSNRALRDRNECNVLPKGETPAVQNIKKPVSNKRKYPYNDNYDISTVIDKDAIQNASKKRNCEVNKEPNKSPEDACKNEENNVKTVSQKQPVLFEGGVLRSYQIDGLEWLKALYENAVNGILADEMGLGKTLQSIALICHLIEMKVSGPFLIIGPLSTLPNWVMEFKRFAPKVPVILFHGNKEKRAALLPLIRTKHEVPGFHRTYPVVVTSYQIPLSDSARELQNIKWRYIIVDEGHRLKNHKSMLSRALRKYNAANRLLLTGTPLHNDLTELWSLLNFLLPEIFNDLSVFESWFMASELTQMSSDVKIIEQEKKMNVLSTMHQILTPFVLRRLKTDVELKLPPKKEVLVYCPMTELQMALYKATVDRNIEMLRHKEENVLPDNKDGTRKKRRCVLAKKPVYGFTDDDDDDDPEEWEEIVHEKNMITVVDKKDQKYRISIKMQNPMMQLRKIVNHPYLVQQPLLPDGAVRIDETMVDKSGKMLVLDALLPRLKAQGHKVLLFSTFTIMLDVLEEYMQMRDYQYSRLDGSMQYSERVDNIQHFSHSEDTFIFLISTRAGGLGLNLTTADTVIIYDSDWNPQADLQAQDRCHRIGQTKPVVVYRLVTTASIDEKIVSLAEAKRKLERMVIHKGKFKGNVEQKAEVVDLEELKNLLNSSDERKVVHSEGSVLTEEELLVLLDRSDLLSQMENNK